MDRDPLVDQILATWQRHQDGLLYLLGEVPRGGLTARPTGSRGRDVARQLAHVCRVRQGWVHYHETGERPKIPRVHKGPPPTKAALRKMLRDSGKVVAACLEDALTGRGRIRMFGKDPVRWMAYLVSHESHHRGQIMLALKQSDLRLSQGVSVDGVWGRWIRGA